MKYCYLKLIIESLYKEAVKVFTRTVVGAIGGIMTESLIVYLRTTLYFFRINWIDCRWYFNRNDCCINYVYN